ncbi:MAG: glycosyltransferase family 4 protein [Chthonomonadales bacterium]|nr:glycosyltransferase family 4 protein [Chthonomonadales bacterium]
MKAACRAGFVMEQTLGHVTHDRNLRQHAALDPLLAPEWLPVEYGARDAWQRAPVVRSNWTLRASLRARDALRGLFRAGQPDVLFMHTQVTALLAPPFMRRVPTVVSLDATPLNVDTLGAAYDHRPSRVVPVERWKNRLTRRTFGAAAHLVSWSHWAKRSLVADYAIPEDRVTVIPPGVDMDRWRCVREEAAGGRPVRLLFVGGNFRRKGGAVLLDAFRARLAAHCTLDIVTREPVDAAGVPGVCVHRGLSSNDPALLALYRHADAFVFPTLGDCLPIAVMEAMAASLPVVATTVGALEEAVVDGETGFLLPPGDGQGLAEAVERLVASPRLRLTMGQAGRLRAEGRFDAARNYGALIALCKDVAHGRA